MAGFFRTTEGDVMSHSSRGPAPRVPSRPNPAAIHALGEDLAAAASARRRTRSLQTCHRPAMQAAAAPLPRASRAYVPQFSAQLLNDPGLSDGARRCAIKLLEFAYRRDRAGRTFQGTVGYIAKALGRSERAVQNYLAQLRGRGYIRHEVITSERARMCTGILVTLLKPLFAHHHADEWPHHERPRSMKSGVKPFSENYRPDSRFKRRGRRVSAEFWALRCMDGVFRALIRTPAPCGSFA